MTAQESKLSNAYESTITTALTADASGITISVDTAPTDSTNTAITGSVVMYLVLDPDSDSQREYVKVTNISGTTLTVVRNIDTGGGGLRTHSAGAKIRQVAQAQHFDDIHDRIDKVINEDGSSLNTTTGVVKDEDDMVSDSATHLATQQSIKAYVDSQVTAQDLDFTADTTTGTPSIDLDSETLNVAGGTGIDTSANGNEITIDIDSTVTTNSGSQTLTNKTIDVDNNTVSNIEVDNLKSGVLDTDLTTVSATDNTLPSAKAVKSYVDAQVTAQDLDLVADTGTDSIDLDSETLTIAGGTGIETTANGAGTVTVDIDSTVTTNSGNQTLTNKTIDADNNTVSNLEVDNLKSGVLDTDLTTVSASDDTLASAKAIKTYVDAQVDTKDTLEELDDVTITTVADNDVIAYDSTSSKYINQSASEAGLATSAQGALADSAVQPSDNVSDLTNDAGYITASSTDSLTNKTIDANGTGNSISNIEVADLAGSAVVTEAEGIASNDNDTTLPTSAAVKDYVDTQVQTADTLGELNDVTITTVADNDVIAYDSTSGDYINQSASEAGLATSAQGALADSAVQPSSTDTLTNKTIDADSNTITNIENADIKSGAAIDATKIHDGSVTNTEFGYIGGLTSDAQTQIDGKLSDITAESVGDLTDVNITGVTNGQVLVYNSTSGDFEPGSVGSATSLVDSDSDLTLTDGLNNGLDYDLDNTDMATWNNAGIALTTNGGVFQHNQTQAATYTIASGNGTVLAGPITITGTITNSGTMVIL